MNLGAVKTVVTNVYIPIRYNISSLMKIFANICLFQINILRVSYHGKPYKLNSYANTTNKNVSATKIILILFVCLAKKKKTRKF